MWRSRFWRRRMWLWVPVLVGTMMVVSGALSAAPVEAAASSGAAATSAQARGAASAARDGRDSEAFSDDVSHHGENLVRLANFTDHRFAFRGHVQLARLEGKTVHVTNLALAFSSCVGCQTVAVALQLDLIDSDAYHIYANNHAIAGNSECVGCNTVAIALQYVLVANEFDVPKGAGSLIAHMNRAFVAIERDSDIAPDTAVRRINSVIADFVQLERSLSLQAPHAAPMINPHANSAAWVSVTPGGPSLMPALPGTPYLGVATAHKPKEQIDR